MYRLKIIFRLTVLVLFTCMIARCTDHKNSSAREARILFLHHSTGSVIFEGRRKTISILGHTIGGKSDVPKWFNKYNKSKGTAYKITERNFPNEVPYGWSNYPYDYYNIWVKHGGNSPYMSEPTLEILTKQYDVIIFKHCYPVSDVLEDINKPDIDSQEKRIENYKLQYLALKKKMLEFPDTKFIIWTGAARSESQTNPANAARAKAFFDWVRNEWDTPNDNIFVFDFESLETEGGLYLKKEFANNSADSHPSKEFAGNVAPLFCQRIVDVIENNGIKTSLTGVLKK
jgi:hypothetical protein